MELKCPLNGALPLLADTDGDGLCDGPINIGANWALGGEDPMQTAGDEDETHPNRADTDFDGLADGFEDQNQMGCSTKVRQIRLADTDGDGLSDGCYAGLETVGACEDKNNNGVIDDGETDPLNADQMVMVFQMAMSRSFLRLILTTHSPRRRPMPTET